MAFSPPFGSLPSLRVHAGDFAMTDSLVAALITVPVAVLHHLALGSSLRSSGLHALGSGGWALTLGLGHRLSGHLLHHPRHANVPLG